MTIQFNSTLLGGGAARETLEMERMRRQFSRLAGWLMDDPLMMDGWMEAPRHVR